MTEKTPRRKSAAAAEPDADTPADIDFEAALAELEQLVAGMEAGDMTLKASLTAFERGVALTRQCQTALRRAELRVRQLTRDDELEDLDLEDLDDT